MKKIASCILPGLGDCLADEWSRGLIQFGGTVVCATAASILGDGYHYDELAAAFVVGGLALWVWRLLIFRFPKEKRRRLGAFIIFLSQQQDEELAGDDA